MNNLIKTWQACCTQKSTPAGVYFDVAMATHSVPDQYNAGMVIPVFELNKTLSASLSLIRGPSVMFSLHMFQIGPSILPCKAKNG